MQARASRKLFQLYQPLVHVFWGLILVYALLLTYKSITDKPHYYLLNFVALVSLFVLPGVAGARIVNRCHYTLMSPIVWCLASVGIYFALGPSLFLFAEQELIDRVSHATPIVVGLPELWETTAANMLCFISILGAFLLTSLLIPTKVPTYTGGARKNLNPSNAIPIGPAKQAAIACLVVGAFIKYGLTLPVDFGFIDLTLPGFIQTMSNFLLIGVFLLAFISYRGELPWRITFYSIVVIELVVRSLSFSKLKILILLLMVVLGRFLAHRRLRSLIINGMLIMLVYIVLKPIFSRGRLHLDKVNARSGASFEQRSQAIVESYQSIELENEVGDRVGWWSRLCLTPYQFFAMQQYDGGLPGDSMRHVPYVLVPRILWPEKPVISDLGREYNDLLRGNRMSSTAVGVVGESYWNGGNWLLVLVSCYIGFILAMTSALATQMVFKQQWVTMPALLLGIRTGLSIDGWFAMTFVGQVGLYFVILLMLLFAQSMIKKFMNFLRPAKNTLRFATQGVRNGPFGRL